MSKARDKSSQGSVRGDTAAHVWDSRERLDAVLRGIGDGITVQDTDGRLVYANDAAAQMVGYASAIDLLRAPAHDILGRFAIYDERGEAVPPADLPGRRVLDGAPHASARLRYRILATDEQRWSVVNATAVRDSLGAIEFVINIFHDDTQRRRADIAANQLAALVASSEDAIIGKSLDGVITSWNPAAERLFGYTAAEALGQPIVSLVPPVGADALPALFARLRAGERVAPLTTLRRRRDGSPVDVSMRVSPMRDGEDRLVGLSTIARDVTSRKRVMDGLRLLAAAGDILGSSLDYATTLASVAQIVVPHLADWCSVHVVEADAERPRQVALAHVDPAKVARVRELQEQFNFDYDDDSGLSCVIRTGTMSVVRDITDDMLAASARSPEHLAALRELGPTASMIVPLTARGRTFGAMSLAITESGRRLTDADVALAQELARRAGMAIDNARLLRNAEQAARAREDFLLTASHELKTPLTSVKGAAQLLGRYIARAPFDQERAEALATRLQQEVLRLEALVADLLDAARIQRGRLDLRPRRTDLAELARRAVERAVGTPVHMPNHTLTLDAPVPVVGDWDPARLAQVLDNLIVNALKYSPDGGEVVVRVHAEPPPGVALLSVADQGIGIGPADLPKLFQPFARADGVRETTGGTGLGLYITRQLVEAHGGTIEVASELGVGSRFSVRLPLRA